MKTVINNSVRKVALRVVRSLAIDATLGAVFGGLYGLVSGGFGALIHGDAQRLVSIAGFFALCGAAAGALVGACGEIWTRKTESKECSDSSPAVSPQKDAPVQAAGHWTVSCQGQPQHSPAAAVTADRRRVLTMAAQHPLSC